jgi:hypothetical protein
MSDHDVSRLESELERARALLREERAAFEDRVLALETGQAELAAQVRRLRRALRRARSRSDAVAPEDQAAGSDPGGNVPIGRSRARFRGRR